MTLLRSPLRKIYAATCGGAATSELLEGALRRGTRFVFRHGYVLLGEIVLSPRPVTGDAITPQSGITMLALSGLAASLRSRYGLCVL